MTSRRLIPLRRLLCLDQVVAVAGNPHRILNARDRNPRYKVIVNVDDLSGQDDAIADLGGVVVFRGTFSHHEYLAQGKREAR